MGDYIMDMRKRVGHIPLMQCGASVIVENERGEILLQVLKRLAQIGLTHVQLLGGTRLRAQTRNGDGAAKLMDIHFCSRASRSCIHAFRAG